MHQNFFNLIAAIPATLASIILIAITIISGINGNTVDMYVGVAASCLVSFTATAIWIKFARGW